MAIYNKAVTTLGAIYTNGSSFGGATVNAGDTILFDSGTHIGYQTFRNYIGTEANPIIIDLNAQTIDGQNNSSWTGIALEDCDHIEVKNGSLVNITQSKSGVLAREGSYIIDGLTITGGNQCIAIHNDEAIGSNYINRRTDYPPDGVGNEYVTVKNCTLSGAQYEGIYIGASNTEKWLQDTTDRSVIYEQPLVRDAIVENCNVSNCGDDGIQVGALSMIVRDNTITNVGTALGTHTSGIQINPIGSVEVYRNFIKDCGPGIFIACSNSRVYNNIIKDAKNGVALTFTKQEANENHWFFNNTMTDINQHCIPNWNGIAPNNRLWNNIMHLTAPEDGSTHSFYYVGTDRNVNMDEQNNIEVDSAAGLTALNFTDYANDDLTLGVGSTAIDAGQNLYDDLDYLRTNYSGSNRSSSGSWDSGAY
jgi:hypothetical protein